jgi:DNA polymerase III epsilon subunit-like protein
MTFTAIDFETAIGHHPTVGIVTVENGVIVDEFVSLIRPPNNEYSPFTSKYMVSTHEIPMQRHLLKFSRNSKPAKQVRCS